MCLCQGSGLVMGGDEYQACPSCALRERAEQRESWRDLRAAGADELELLRASGKN